MQMEYIKCLGNSGLVLDLLVKRLWKVATGYHPEETERPCIHSLVRILILWYTGKKEVSTYLRYWYLGSLCFAVAVTNLRDGSLTCWKFWWKLAKGCCPEENTRQCMIFFVRIECFLTIQLSKEMWFNSWFINWSKRKKSPKSWILRPFNFRVDCIIFK